MPGHGQTLRCTHPTEGLRALRNRLVSTIATSTCVLALTLPAAASAFRVVAVQRDGSVTSETENVRGGTDYAEMETAFIPTQIKPGEAVTFASRLTVFQAGFYDPHNCTDFTRDQTDTYDSLGMWRVRPHSTPYEPPGDPTHEPPMGLVVSTPVYSNFTSTTAQCPNGNYDENEVVSIPGDATAKLGPGCYQSAEVSSGLWFPPGVSLFSPTQGSFATLTIGNMHCARKVDPNKWINCGKLGCEAFVVGPGFESDAPQPSLSQAIELSVSSGSSTGSGMGGGLKPVAVPIRSTISLFTLARTQVALHPNQGARIRMHLTRRGRKAVAKALRKGNHGPFKGWLKFNGDRSTRERVKIRLR